MAAQFIIYRDKGTFRWYLTAEEGVVIFRHDHAYSSPEEAAVAIQSVIDNIPNATIVDDGDPPDDEEAAAARRAAEAAEAARVKAVAQSQGDLKKISQQRKQRGAGKTSPKIV